MVRWWLFHGDQNGLARAVRKVRSGDVGFRRGRFFFRLAKSMRANDDRSKRGSLGSGPRPLDPSDRGGYPVSNGKAFCSILTRQASIYAEILPGIETPFHFRTGQIMLLAETAVPPTRVHGERQCHPRSPPTWWTDISDSEFAVFEACRKSQVINMNIVETLHDAL